MFLFVIGLLFLFVEPCNKHNLDCKLNADLSFFKDAAFDLEYFYEEVSCSKKLSSTRHAQVLLIETTETKKEELNKRVIELFHPNKFNVLVMSDNSKLTQDFFVKYDKRPIVVIVQNASKLTREQYLSYAASMSNSLLISSEGITRVPYNMGFIFLGYSLPEDVEQCNNLNLLDYYLNNDVVGSFITRVNNHVKIC